MARLVFIHGRSQENKDAQALKDSWVRSLKEGLNKSNLQLPIKESDIAFPYYGQTLADLVSGEAADRIAQIVIRGSQGAIPEQNFVLDVLKEIAEQQGVTATELATIAESAVTQRGIQNWELVQRILIALDRHIPAVSLATIAIATQDVYRYLFNPAVAATIDAGVRTTFAKDTATVVVSHSLGTIVAFNILKEMKKEALRVPLFVTLGSPLAIGPIRKRLSPIKHPACVEKWYNAMDDRDVVALYPLDAENFKVVPAIENKLDVDNPTEDRHGIEGYLGDPVVARRIYEALRC